MTTAGIAPLVLGAATAAFLLFPGRGAHPAEPAAAEYQENELQFGNVVPFNDHMANEIAKGHRDEIHSIVESIENSNNSGVVHPHKVVTVMLKSGEMCHFERGIPFSMDRGVPSHK